MRQQRVHLRKIAFVQGNTDLHRQKRLLGGFEDAKEKIKIPLSARKSIMEIRRTVKGQIDKVNARLLYGIISVWVSFSSRRARPFICRKSPEGMAFSLQNRI